MTPAATLTRCRQPQLLRPGSTAAGVGQAQSRDPPVMAAGLNGLRFKSGPATALSHHPSPLGYRDGVGRTIRGAYADSASGEPPWGTVLSAEQHVQRQVCEPAVADGSATPPRQRSFLGVGSRLDGLGNRS